MRVTVYWVDELTREHKRVKDDDIANIIANEAVRTKAIAYINGSGRFYYKQLDSNLLMLEKAK